MDPTGKFIGYHCSGSDMEPTDFKGSTVGYAPYYNNIIVKLPEELKIKIYSDIAYFNQLAEISDSPQINLRNIPKTMTSSYDEDLMNELGEIIDDVIGGIIFVDEKEPRIEFGADCYEVFIKGNNFFSIDDKLSGDIHHSKIYVYFKGTHPVLKKIKEHSLVAENIRKYIRKVLNEEFKKKLFNSEADRELWIKLNAERQIEWEKNLTYFDSELQTHKPTLQALNPRSMEEALRISRNQCEYDEKEGKLRYSLEELLLLDQNVLAKIGQKRHKEKNGLKN